MFSELDVKIIIDRGKLQGKYTETRERPRLTPHPHEIIRSFYDLFSLLKSLFVYFLYTYLTFENNGTLFVIFRLKLTDRKHRSVDYHR